MLVQLLFLLLDVAYCVDFIQPHHASLTQQAAVSCWTTESEYHLKFYLVKNSDQIEAVYTVNSRNVSDVSLGVFDSAGNGIEGDGTPASPFTFEVKGVGNLPDTPITCDAADVELRNTRVEGSDVIVLDVMAKSRIIPGMGHLILFAEDVVYAAACNFSEVQPLVVSSGKLTVEGSVDEESKQTVDVAKLVVLKDGSLATQVALGDQIQLAVVIDNPQAATGVYVHTCSICNTDDCGDKTFLFVDSNGCSDLVGPFLPGAGVSAVTAPFYIFTFAGQSKMVLRCKANNCFDLADARCQNYCAYNGGRNRRQAGEPGPASEDRDVWTQLLIETIVIKREEADDLEQKGDAVALEKASKLDMDIMLTVIVLGGLLLVALIVSCVVFFCLTSRRRNKEQSPSTRS